MGKFIVKIREVGVLHDDKWCGNNDSNDASRENFVWDDGKGLVGDHVGENEGDE